MTRPYKFEDRSCTLFYFIFSQDAQLPHARAQPTASCSTPRERAFAEKALHRRRDPTAGHGVGVGPWRHGPAPPLPPRAVQGRLEVGALHNL